MTQEVVTEAPALRGPFNEPGDVGDNELRGVAGSRGPVTHAHHAEIGNERGEGVVRDLGTSGRDSRDQRGLAHVGKTDQRHVGLEFQARG